MAIKTASQGTVPALTLDYIQFSKVNIAVSKRDPHTISVNCIVHPYGKDSDGNRHYVGEQTFAIGDVKQYIGGLDASGQAKAVAAMKKVQEGLGVLAELKLDIPFDSYE